MNKLEVLKGQLDGDLFLDNTMRTLYATDASAYREIPLAVAVPKTTKDIQTLVVFAKQEELSLIPRTAGTSLAGQVVGSGIVVDVSKHLNKILEVNKKEKWVRVQPGVVRDELNLFLKPYGLYFGPETSTANRAMIGGMVGNNSCGSNSLVYGSTREHVISLKTILSDGSEVEFGPVKKSEYDSKTNGNTLESHIYKRTFDLLSNKSNQEEIIKQFPKKSVTRRNTGYALDLLMESEIFGFSDRSFNFCKLLAGSEGTLAFTTEIKLHVSDLPLPHRRLVCAHFNSLQESLKANLVALTYKPEASELIDQYIIQSARANIEQRRNSFFIQGDPAAILVVELARATEEDVEKDVASLIADFKKNNFGYHFPVLSKEDAGKVWNLRKAGLGLLSNIPGDAKPVPVIEDTAVDVNDLPDYIAEFNQILDKYGLHSVHYAHAGSGELHLRPIINLKTKEGNQLFRTILEEVAALVKKYNGSLSGEHGDGRLRGEFIKFMVGEKNYELMREIKKLWDPDNIFNPNKIVDTPPMNESLRFLPGQETPGYKTAFDFSKSGGYLRATEQCNGSGDCRKTAIMGGTMCPSYQATKNEKDTTRARANILREMLSRQKTEHPFNSKEVLEVLELCISCKGCKSECPSNVDMARLKSEYLYQYYKTNRRNLNDWLIAHNHVINKLALAVPGLFNFFVTNGFFSKIIKSFSGIANKRSIPTIPAVSTKSWYRKNKNQFDKSTPNASIKGQVYLFIDEFTNYGSSDAEVGKKAIELLTVLGYKVDVLNHDISGRAYISKGYLNKARKVAVNNVLALKDKVNENSVLIGLEPSAILTFRDEYPDLVGKELQKEASELSKHVLLVDEFFENEIQKGNITSDSFSEDKRKIAFHGHCHQKSLSSVSSTVKMLSIPKNYSVNVIPSGCCGMAGSFGYEKAHYDVSMSIGELKLFPAIRSLSNDVIVAANGTSCRHQIKDGTKKNVLHPVEILHNALKIMVN